MQFNRLNRRSFITLIGGSAVWPITARAQEPGRMYRLGFLTGGLRQAPEYLAIFDELRLSGFIEGRNLTIMSGGFGLRNEQLAETAAAIVRSAPDAKGHERATHQRENYLSCAE